MTGGHPYDAPVTDAEPAGVDEPLVRVRIRRFPVAMYARAQEHSDELIRELTLIAQQMHEHELHREVPGRLIVLIEDLTKRYAGFGAAPDERIARAVAAGEEEIDEVVFDVPASVGDAAARLDRMLDEADEFCRRGKDLLTLATPPDIVRFRKWYLAEFSRQAADAPPVPWPEFTG
jgi:hypothetical protein